MAKKPAKKPVKNTAKKGVKKKGNTKPHKKWIRLFWLCFAMPFLGLSSLLLVAYLGDLPATEELANPKTNLATEVITADSKVIGRYYKENRSDIKFENLPPHLVNALISTEDARYREHSGIDFRGLARAVAKMGKGGGGSTLSQQLAKLLFTADAENISKMERVLLQKPREWIIATRLEKQYTKDEILALYLNRVDFLYQAVGIKSAAQVYFNKPVDSLNVQEAAMIVGMLKNPSLYNPKKRPELALRRREVVMSQMVKYGYLEQAAYDSLRLEPLAMDFQIISHDEGSAPYFREVLRSELKKLLEKQDEDGNYLVSRKRDGSTYDIYGDGLKIYTTIDSRLQEYAEYAVHRHLGEELQASFNKDLKRRKEKNYPFYNGIKTKDRDRIIGYAVKNSDRHKMLTGNLCPNCKRPKFYIRKTTEDGRNLFYCSAEDAGCGHKWESLSEDQIDAKFAEEVPMKIFTHNGMVDTLMSPMDSILYHKTFLHAGLMSVEPTTGHIKAWVGGINYKQFQYDNVYQSRRQVGSTFKPFVYAQALQARPDKYAPCKELPNQKVCIDMPDGQKPWCPENSDFKYGDMMSLKYALANSVNTLTTRLIKDLGPRPVIDLAHKMGITSKLPEVPSLALGVAELSLYEMTVANATLANYGMYVEPTFILRIEDKNGDVIYEADPNPHEALRPDIAFTTLKMMKGVCDGAYSRERGKRSGTGVRLKMDVKSRKYDNLQVPIAAKTGTTQNNTDGWFMGLTPELVTGVWVGAQDPAVRFSRTSLGQGANTALPIFGYYMHKAYDDKSIGFTKADFELPEGVLNTMELDCDLYMGTPGSTNFDDLPAEESEEGIFD